MQKAEVIVDPSHVMIADNGLLTPIVTRWMLCVVNQRNVNE